MFLFAFLEYFFSNADYENFWQIKLRGILLGLLLIPTLFYTLNGVFGKVPDWVNILTFFIAAGVAYYYETKLFQREPAFLLSTPYSLLILFIIAGLLILFTFFPPHIPLFQDPITKGYSFTP
jgi:L-asparagine transporter-like permease